MSSIDVRTLAEQPSIQHRVADPLAPDNYVLDEIVSAEIQAAIGDHLADDETLARRASEDAAAAAAAAAIEAEASAEEAAALAEEAVGAVLMDPDDDDGEGGMIDGDDDIALAAAAAAAAVQAEVMAVVVDQALLATAAAAAASQVASVFQDDPNDQSLHHHHDGIPSDYYTHDPTHLHLPHDETGFMGDDCHDDLLEQRRIKDRKRYACMSEDQRAVYNAHRRELYHKQGEEARKRRRERERNRYHSLEGDAKKDRNARRAKLERDRYNKLSKDELEDRNSSRRDRAKMKRSEKQSAVTGEDGVHLSVGDHDPLMLASDPPKSLHADGTQHYQMEVENHHHNHGVSQDAIADAVSAAADVAEQTIGAMMNAEAVAVIMDAVDENDDANTIEI